MEDRSYDVEVQSLIVVNGDVAEADHALEPVGQLSIERAGSDQELERVAALLWNAQPPYAHRMHREIDGRFARVLDVEDDRILPGQIVGEIGIEPAVDLAGPTNAPLDDRRLSMIAALFRATSGVDTPISGDLFEDGSALVLEARVVGARGGFEQRSFVGGAVVQEASVR